MKQALILAGGKGTRLREVLGDIPKPLAEVGGRPLLEHQIRLLSQHGFTDVIVLVNHGATAIAAWLEGARDLDINVELVDDGIPRGTAGAVLNILPRLAQKFILLYADTMMGVDLKRFWYWHDADPDASAALFLHPNDHPADSDLVEIDDSGRILRFHPYPHPEGKWMPNLVNAALYIVKRDALRPWLDAAPPLDFGKDLFPSMLDAGHVLRGYVSSEYIKDAGTPARLEKVRAAYSTGLIERASLDRRQRAVLIDRDGTINACGGHIARADDLRIFPFVGPAIRRLNESEWRTIVITNQPVLARGETSEAEMRRIHARLDSELGTNHAFLDRLYMCPHHPDTGFAGEVKELKIDCECRKPKAGLIDKAVHDLNIDLSESWLVGDSTADLGAAEAAEVASILVTTGCGGLDERYPYERGFSQPNFAVAVDFILDSYPRVAELCAPLVQAAAPSQDVFVGGLTSAGKSTVASTIVRELRRAGHNAIAIQLDRWRISEDNSKDGLFAHFDLPAAADIVARASERTANYDGYVTLDLPTYSRRKKQLSSHRRVVSLTAETIVVWEGAIALEMAMRLGRFDSAIAVHADHEGRKRRFYAACALRGVPPSESQHLWERRERDERPAINHLLDLARHQISLDRAFSQATSESSS